MLSDTRPSRRYLVLGALGVVGVSAAGLTGCSATTGPTLSDGVLSDRFGVVAPRWRLAVPRSGPAKGLVVALHGFGGGADDAYGLGFADAVEPSRMALVSVDGGNSYWHPRRDGSETPARAYDGRADFDRHSIFNRVDKLRGIPVRLDCGTADPFIAANRVLAARLPAAEAHFTKGGHDDAFWSGNVQVEMAWAAART